MGNMVREFMTHWDGAGPIWFERDEDELVGTQRSGGRPMPRIRTFDLFRGPTNLQGMKAPVVWAGEDGVIEAHNPVGPEPCFHRPSDFDVLVFQFSGLAAAETEMGEFQLTPGDSMHVPAGVAYRIIGGGPECRQLVVKLHRPVKLGVDPQSPFTETTFDVRPAGAGRTKREPVAFPERRGRILEVTEFWADTSTPSSSSATMRDWLGAPFPSEAER